MSGALGLIESLPAYLQPGEEIVVVDDRSATAVWKGRRGIEQAPTPDGVKFDKRSMGVVVTNRRFLMFRLGGVLGHAEELLTDLPVGAVDSVECVSHWLKSFEAKLTIGGTEYGFLVAHMSGCHDIARGLEAAKQNAAEA
jgi:hypothetical protein